MPITETAKREMRLAEKRRVRNKSTSSLCKTNVSKAEKLIFSGQMDEAGKAVTTAISALDKAAEKGILHRNNAARRKSRLMKKLNKAQPSSTATA